MPKLESVNGLARRGVDIDERLLSPEGYGVEIFVPVLQNMKTELISLSAHTAINYKDYSMAYIAGSKGGLS